MKTDTQFSITQQYEIISKLNIFFENPKPNINKILKKLNVLMDKFVEDLEEIKFDKYTVPIYSNFEQYDEDVNIIEFNFSDFLANVIKKNEKYKEFIDIKKVRNFIRKYFDDIITSEDLRDKLKNLDKA